MRHVRLLRVDEEHKTDSCRMVQAVAGARSRWPVVDVATSAVVILTFFDVVLLGNMLLHLISVVQNTLFQRNRFNLLLLLLRCYCCCCCCCCYCCCCCCCC